MASRRTKGRPGAQAAALSAALGASFGDAGVYMPDRENLRPRVLSCGIDPLDVATGVGGYPEGRVIVMHGPQSCGKTTAAGKLVAHAQSLDGTAVYIDGERKLDLPYMATLGVDLDRLVVVRPRYIEEAFQLIEHAGTFVRKEQGSDGPIVVVWDSIHSLPAKRTYDNVFEKEQYSPEASAYDRGFKKGVGIVADHRILLVMISQVRMSPDGFVVKEKVGIGKAVGHAATIIVQFKQPQAIGKLGDGRLGNKVRFVLPKNQIGRPWVAGEFDLMFGSGVDPGFALLSAAKMTGVAGKTLKGGWVDLDTPDGVVRVQGAGGLNAMRERDPERFAALREYVRLRTPAGTVEPEGEGEDEEAPAEEAPEAEAKEEAT